MTEWEVVKALNTLPAGGLNGRRKIKTSVKRVTADNLLVVLGKALAIHRKNAAEIKYLWNYYRGMQDIRFKQKYVRENINNIVTVNRANEIVTFKTAFLLEEPVQYISHGGDDEVSKLVNTFNEYMRAADKESADKDIVDWMHICGVGERLVRRGEHPEESPFDIYTLDPTQAFVIYSTGIGEEPMAGVIIGQDEDEVTTYDVYTVDRHYFVKNDTVSDLGNPQYGAIPLVEYANNKARMGAFESVISILNNINRLESDAVDSIQDFVNGFDVFQNCDIEDGVYSQLSLGGKAIKIKTSVQGMDAKVYRVASEINQNGVQSRIDDLTDAYLEICGMPNRNGGSSTSDTGMAVLFRDGWSEAASRARDTEIMFRKSEKQFDRVVINICKVQRVEVPELYQFDPEFPRAKLSNLQSKTQVLCELLNQPYVHPKYAYIAADLFDDREEALRAGLEWHDELERKQEEALDNIVANEREAEKLRTVGQDDKDAEQESNGSVQ